MFHVKPNRVFHMKPKAVFPSTCCRGRGDPPFRPWVPLAPNTPPTPPTLEVHHGRPDPTPSCLDGRDRASPRRHATHPLCWGRCWGRSPHHSISSNDFKDLRSKYGGLPIRYTRETHQTR